MSTAERRESFPIETWRHLENKLGALRANIMYQAAEMAAKRDTNPEIYTVTPDDVEHALKPITDALQAQGIRAFDRSHAANIRKPLTPESPTP